MRNCGVGYSNSPDRSTTYDTSDYGKCTCNTGYYFSTDSNDFKNQCILICTKADFTLDTHVTVLQCKCNQTGFTYNSTAGACTVDCVGLADSPGVLDPTSKLLSMCACNSGFMYSPFY